MLNYQWEQAGNKFECCIFQLDASLLVSFILFLLLIFSFLFLLLHLHYFLCSFISDGDVLNVEVGSVFEWIYLSNCSLHALLKLMRSDALQYPIACISQDDVSLGIQL